MDIDLGGVNEWTVSQLESLPGGCNLDAHLKLSLLLLRKAYYRFLAYLQFLATNPLT